MYMNGLERSGVDTNTNYGESNVRQRAGLGYIEGMRCCADKSMRLANCQEFSIESAFDEAGKQYCPYGKVMTGMYRSSFDCAHSCNQKPSGYTCTNQCTLNEVQRRAYDVQVDIRYLETFRCCDVVNDEPLADLPGTGLARSMIDSPQAWQPASESEHVKHGGGVEYAAASWMVIDAGAEARPRLADRTTTLPLPSL